MNTESAPEKPKRLEDILKSKVLELEKLLDEARRELREYESMLSEWGDDGGAGGNGHE